MKITVSKLRDIIREVLTEMNVIGARAGTERAQHSLAQATLQGADLDKKLAEITQQMNAVGCCGPKWQELKDQFRELIAAERAGR